MCIRDSLLPLPPPLPPPPQGPPLFSAIKQIPFSVFKQVLYTWGFLISIQAFRIGDFIVTNSSDMVGWTAQTLSKSSFVAPIFTAIPAI